MRLLTLFYLFLLTFGAAPEVHAGGPAARQGDTTTHNGMIIAGSPTVLISDAPAARLGDFVVCPEVSQNGGVPVPHVGGQIITGVPTVLIDGMPAATVGDTVQEVGVQSAINLGAPTVLIGTGN